MARNYQQAKIYCIKVNTEEEYLPYIGSSCKRLLSQRMNQHRDDYKKWKNGKYGLLSSFTLFEKYGIENCFIELIESFPCKCNDELRKKEREYIEKQECCNKVKRVIITKEERVELCKIIGKIYRDEHKEQIAERDKIYRDSKKEIISEKGKMYYEKIKNELLEKRKEKYDCPCGSTLRISDKSQHEKTKKHQEYLTKLTVCVPAITDLS